MKIKVGIVIYRISLYWSYHLKNKMKKIKENNYYKKILFCSSIYVVRVGNNLGFSLGIGKYGS
jgi:hypothetical protein